ncbi:hypothetical protein OF83DRAFT_775746 [Amylostereum chailletii]|nr:hypothetical protein OF83DRAFT_775746 [Amylostereum chailletii]
MQQPHLDQSSLGDLPLLPRTTSITHAPRRSSVSNAPPAYSKDGKPPAYTQVPLKMPEPVHHSSTDLEPALPPPSPSDLENGPGVLPPYTLPRFSRRFRYSRWSCTIFFIFLVVGLTVGGIIRGTWHDSNEDNSDANAT